MNGGCYGNERSKGGGIPTNSGDLHVIYHPTGVQVNGGGNFNGGTTLIDAQMNSVYVPPGNEVNVDGYEKGSNYPTVTMQNHSIDTWIDQLSPFTCKQCKEKKYILTTLQYTYSQTNNYPDLMCPISLVILHIGSNL